MHYIFQKIGIREFKKELFRKCIHMMSAFTPLLAYFTSKQFVVILLFIISILYSITEFLRCKGKRVSGVSAIVEMANRNGFEQNFSLGPITLSFGVMIALYFFSFDVATIAIFALSFGDGVASLVGRTLGSHRFFFHDKTMEGSAACFIATFIAEFVLTNNAFLSLLIATITTMIELIPLKDFDNLVIPLSIAIIIQYFCR